MKGKLFYPCEFLAHGACGQVVDYDDDKRYCTCRCHIEKEKSVDYEIKTTTKVTGVTVTLTPEMARETWGAVTEWSSQGERLYVQWERVIKAMDGAEQ